MLYWDFTGEQPGQQQTKEEILQVKAGALKVRLYIKETGQFLTLGLEDYVRGVVAAEMPADFNLEALKAQAVAARTYAANNLPEFGGVPGRPGADLTNAYHGAQAWQSETQLQKKWGQAFNQNW